jgi:predicted AlkP superfamily pyrophosphatase or phosphodiesterase
VLPSGAAPLLAAIALQAQAPRPVARSPAIKPKLVVLISVDQMRGDYVDRFRQQWSKGLHRLVTEGAWFRQADYPYYTTVTCAGHASISTGTVPAVTAWWRTRGRCRTTAGSSAARTMNHRS